MQPHGGGQLPWPATSNSLSKPPATENKNKKKWLRWAIPLAVVAIAITILGACLGTQLNKHPTAMPMRLGNGTSESTTDLQDTGHQAGVGDYHNHNHNHTYDQHSSSDGVPRVGLPNRGVPSGSSLPQPDGPAVPVSPVPVSPIVPVPPITPMSPTNHTNSINATNPPNAPSHPFHNQTQTHPISPTTTNPTFSILPLNPITPIPIPIPIPNNPQTTPQTKANPSNPPNPNTPQPAPKTAPTKPTTGLTPLPMTTGEECTTLHGITYTFYGYPDNDPPGAAIAYDCPNRSGSGTAGGTGTYDDPLTFATAPGEFELCEVIYSPYLQKYLIHEDYCESCTRHWPHMWHVDVWLGGDSVGAAAEQLSCEARLTPEVESQSVVRWPGRDLVVDGTTFYAGGYSACGVEHVYHAAGAGDYC